MYYCRIDNWKCKVKVCISCQEKYESPNWECPSCGYIPENRGDFLCFAPGLIEDSGGFNPEFFEYLYRHESRYFWFRARNRLINWTLKRYFGRAETMLEIGCGTGFVLDGIHSAFPGMRLHGSEVLIDGLSFARRRLPEADLFQMDARRIPYEKEFDVIGAFDVLEHIEEDRDVLGQMFQATKPGGGIIVTVPQHRFLWSAVDEYSYHKRRYTRKELVEKIENAGFRIIRVTSFVMLLMPLLLISRFLKCGKSRDYDPNEEFELNPALNKAMEIVLSGELVVIKCGISLPFGSSLIAVAQK